ncbi:MAG TPA: hypothetical protein VGN37_05230 [Actinocatenispora sp.]
MTHPDPRYPGGLPPRHTDRDAAGYPDQPTSFQPYDQGQPPDQGPARPYDQGQPYDQGRPRELGSTYAQGQPYVPGPAHAPGPTLGAPPPSPFAPAPGSGVPSRPFGTGMPPGEPVRPFDQPRPPHPTGTPVPPRRDGPRRWPKVLAAVAAVLLLGGLLAGSYALVKGNPQDTPTAGPKHSATSAPTPSPTQSPIDVSTRQTDPKPLSVAEVWGSEGDLHPDPGRDATYKVLARDTPRTKCGQVATGKVGGVLGKYGCTQVIRATLAAPAKGYVLTAGICNLANSAGAQSAADSIKQLGRQTRGNFAGLSASGAPKLAKSPTVFTLQSYGHYVLYVVVGRTDGKAPKGDATTQQIVTDLVQTYLTGVVDARRNAD